jgi:hypothetical protein
MTDIGEPLARVYFDTNEGNHDYGYWLQLEASRNDLKLIGDRLKDGLRVVLYMTGELELQAYLKFDKAYGYWVGMPIEGTIVYYDEPLDGQS